MNSCCCRTGDEGLSDSFSSSPTCSEVAYSDLYSLLAYLFALFVNWALQNFGMIYIVNFNFLIFLL